MIKENLPMADYLAHPGIGSTNLKVILTSPADYFASSLLPHDETKFTLLGTAIHTAILEHHDFHNRYALQPADWGNKAVLEKNGGGKGRWDAFKKENSHKIVVDFKEAQLIERILEAIKAHPFLLNMVKMGHPELTAFSEWTGRRGLKIPLKARTDLLYFDDSSTPTLVDIKTTSDNVDDGNIFNLIFKSGYHFQAAHHLRVFNSIEDCHKDYMWVFVTTKTPAIHIRVVKAPHELLAWGKRDHDIALDRLEDCLATNHWPGYEPYISHLEIPEWARKIYA